MNINTYAYMKEHDFSGEDILNFLKISHPKQPMDKVFEGRKIFLKGLNIDYTIEFDSNFYLVTKKFNGYTYKEWHSYDGFIIHKETAFNIEDDTISFEQIYNRHNPRNITRSMSLIRNGESKRDASFQKYVNRHRMSTSNEVYTAIKSGNGIKRNRIISDSRNYVISNYQDFVDESTGTPVLGGIKSICSLYPPSIFTYTAPVTNPDQISELDDYETPVVKIKGAFLDRATKKELVNYELLVIKTKSIFEAVISFLDSNGKNSYLTVFPADGHYLFPSDLTTMIEHFQSIGFLEYPGLLPVEESIIKELKKIKKDMATKAFSEGYEDTFESTISSEDDYEHVSLKIYESLRAYRDKALEALKEKEEQVPKI